MPRPHKISNLTQFSQPQLLEGCGRYWVEPMSTEYQQMFFVYNSSHQIPERPSHFLERGSVSPSCEGIRDAMSPSSQDVTVLRVMAYRRRRLTSVLTYCHITAMYDPLPRGSNDANAGTNTDPVGDPTHHADPKNGFRYEIACRAFAL